MYDELIGPPVVYQAPNQDVLGVQMDCGHHLELRKDWDGWGTENLNFPFWCEVCLAEVHLHPLVLLEFEAWRDSTNQEELK